MNNKCPFCGEEMTPGVIQSRDGVYWSRKAGPMAALSWLKKTIHSTQTSCAHPCLRWWRSKNQKTAYRRITLGESSMPSMDWSAKATHKR